MFKGSGFALFEVRDSGFGFRVLGFGFWVLGFGGFEFEDSGFRFGIWGLGFRVWGLGLQYPFGSDLEHVGVVGLPEEDRAAGLGFRV